MRIRWPRIQRRRVHSTLLNSKATCTSTYSRKQFHPGVAIFHEGSKGYSCCSRKVLEFDQFLKLPGCKKGKHRFLEVAGVSLKWGPRLATTMPLILRCCRLTASNKPNKRLRFAMTFIKPRPR